MAVLKEISSHSLLEYLRRKEGTVKLLTLISFIVLILLVGFHHEPWTDEAQSWLIARDTSLTSLFKVMAYEGSPALWPLILKVFIYIRWPYKFLFVIPAMFSAIGVWLFLYKSKTPLIYKIIIPFTYYIFYQYTIIARSYCLIFPCMELIAALYPKRLQKPYVYALLLMLLSGICVHTMLLSGVLFVFFVIDILRYKKAERKSWPIHLYAAATLTAISYCLTAWYLRTPSDCSFPAYLNLSITGVIKNIGGLFGDTYIYNYYTLYGFVILVILTAAFSFYYKFTPRLVIVSSVIWIFLSCFYYNKWHLGMIFLSMILAFQLFPPIARQLTEHTEKYRKYFCAMIYIILCIQCYWSINTAIYDCFNINSGARAAADFIKENDYDTDQIYGVGYCSTAIEPYFETNIFTNKGENTSYYIWSTNSGDLTNVQIINNLPEVLVLSEFDRKKYCDIKAAMDTADYELYQFEGATYIKNATYESQLYYVYVKSAE